MKNDEICGKFHPQAHQKKKTWNTKNINYVLLFCLAKKMISSNGSSINVRQKRHISIHLAIHQYSSTYSGLWWCTFEPTIFKPKSHSHYPRFSQSISIWKFEKWMNSSHWPNFTRISNLDRQLLLVPWQLINCYKPQTQNNYFD